MSKKVYRGAGVARWGAEDGRSPYVGPDGYWYQWDNTVKDFVNTGVKAQGVQGMPGKVPVQKEWKPGDTHRNDTNIVDYIYVRAEEQNHRKWYKLNDTYITRVVPENEHEPSPATIATYYEEVPWLKNLAVNVLLAEEANLANLIFKNERLISVRGAVDGEDVDYDGQENFFPYIIIDGKSGTGSFTNVDIKTSHDGQRLEIDSSGLSIFNMFGNKNIEFGLDENGMAVMRYFDDSGALLYDLGPAGLQKSLARAEAWVQIHTMTFLAAFPDDINPAFNKDLIKNTKNATKATVYRYVSKINAGVNLDEENDGRLFSAQNKNLQYRLNGVFTTIRSANPQYRSDDLQGQLTNLPNMHPSNEAVYGGYSIYFAPVSNYISGKLNQPSTYSYYWNEGRIPE